MPRFVCHPDILESGYVHFIVKVLGGPLGFSVPLTKAIFT